MQSLARGKSVVTWLLVVPMLAWCYIGLFLTMVLWYPAGLPGSQWQAHILHFSIIYILWLAVFFSYRLFDWDALRSTQAFIGRLGVALVICLIIAVIYFYFQPALLITPRRFLLVHMLITGFGICLWYLVMRHAAYRAPRRKVFAHNALSDPEEVRELIEHHQFRGFSYAGTMQTPVQADFPQNSIVIMPARAEISAEDGKALFDLRNQGVKFVEYHELYENLTRTVHLSVLTDLWFIHSIDYGGHYLYDLIKRLIDIALGLIGVAAFFVSFPVIGLLIKTNSRGPVLFKQKRIGRNGIPFSLYKYRSMTSGGVDNTWTAVGDKRITSVGKALRWTRFDELPQSLNILAGQMSIVGPRPEQENIVQELRRQIPYYDERHLVKPGLTGWAQLHVYAGTVEESKRKLQYDLYYIKHRSLLFDAEIIIKTVYNIITFAGR